MKVKTILVIVELENGKAYQVLSRKEQKELALNFLVDEKTGRLQIDSEPLHLDLYPGRKK